MLVVGPDGNPVGGGSVKVLVPQGSYGTRFPTGRAELSIPGPVAEAWVEVGELAATATGAAGRYGPFDIRSGAVTVRLDAGVVLTGRVVGPDGVGVKGVLLTALQPSADASRAPRAWDFEHEGNRVRTGEDGSFAGPRVKPGTWWIALAAPPEYVRPAPQAVELGGAPVVLRLERGLAARITVEDPDGKPVEGAWASVTARTRGDFHEVTFLGRVATGADGVALLRGLPRGEPLLLRVGIDETLREDLTETTIDDWEPRDQVVRLARAYVTEGVVRDTEGNPVAEAPVWCREPGASGATATGTDALGRFRIGPLPFARLEVRVSPGGRDSGLDLAGEAAAVWIAVEAGRKDLVLTVDPVSDLDVTIRDWPPGRDDHLEVIDEADRSLYRRGVRLVAGRVRVRGLVRDHTYCLWVPPGKGYGHVLECGVRADAGSVELSMRRGNAVGGRVTAPDGLDPARVNVAVRCSLGLTASTAVRPDGTWEIADLPDAEWSAFAYATQPEWSIWTATAEVVGGRADLVLARPPEGPR